MSENKEEEIKELLLSYAFEMIAPQTMEQITQQLTKLGDFKIKCDFENNTKETINKHKLIVDVDKTRFILGRRKPFTGTIKSLFEDVEVWTEKL